MKRVTWILDSSIIERLTYSSRSLPDIIKDVGHDVVLIDRQDNGSYSDRPQIEDQCVVLFGAHQFVRAINADGYYQPGALGVSDKTQATQYMSNLPLEWFLNSQGQFMTWNMFKARSKELFYAFDTNRLFIRPNSGFKTFAGQIIKFGTLEHDIETLDKLSSVMGDTLILINEPSELLGEFRFVIADGKVIAGSEYRWDGKLDIRRDWPEECLELAEKVAQHEWQVDIAYTCDVALTSDGPKIIELNGFSCAGLYACDLTKVVEGISAAAHKEFTAYDLP